MPKPSVDCKTGDVTFDNGKVTNVYEAGHVQSLKIKDEQYWLCSGHEEIVIWDDEGNELFTMFTR